MSRGCVSLVSARTAFLKGQVGRQQSPMSGVYSRWLTSYLTHPNPSGMACMLNNDATCQDTQHGFFGFSCRVRRTRFWNPSPKACPNCTSWTKSYGKTRRRLRRCQLSWRLRRLAQRVLAPLRGNSTNGAGCRGWGLSRNQ